MMNPRPGMSIREIENHFDNVYIKDADNRIWQIWFEHGGPMIQLVAYEDN